MLPQHLKHHHHHHHIHIWQQYSKWCTDTSDLGHFGPKTLLTFQTSDLGHFGMSEVSGYFGTGPKCLLDAWHQVWLWMHCLSMVSSICCCSLEYMLERWYQTFRKHDVIHCAQCTHSG